MTVRNYPVESGAYDEYVCVDGLQRLTAITRFIPSFRIMFFAHVKIRVPEACAEFFAILSGYAAFPGKVRNHMEKSTNQKIYELATELERSVQTSAASEKYKTESLSALRQIKRTVKTGQANEAKLYIK